MTTIGLAMIVKNGAATMERAIKSVLPVVDEISIVLGGQSSDNTVEIAAKYTDKLSEYENDSYFNFGQARQQSVDQLTTDWVIWIDADEWVKGAQNIPAAIALAETKEVNLISIINENHGNRFAHKRIARRNSGRWVGAVHEYWQSDKRGLIVESITIQTIKKERSERNQQNVEIGEAWIKDHPNDLRTLAHLARDYAIIGEDDRALQICRRYHRHYGQADRDDELFFVNYIEAGLRMNIKDFDGAHLAALRAVEARPDMGAAWAVAAETAFRLKCYELTVIMADKAISLGRPRSNWPLPMNVNTSAVSYVKALALVKMDRIREAIRALDVALAFEPDNLNAGNLHITLCNQIGEMP